ncbi:MAG: hypothetical protein LBS72_01325 [Oscillospiraceae bacterium]|jgi:tetratricopeptide (TPR) repeat protein|nr:hypothetical protein [Oscillospiraceae bacterium]
MSEHRQGWGQVLPFARSANELQRRALSQRKGKQWLEAAELLRRAMEQEPDNERVLLDLAKTYAEIGCAALSNRVLLRALRQNPNCKECFFEMGCNYYNMQAWSQAHDCLSLYIRNCPLGKNRKEANDMILFLYLQQNSRVEKRIQRATQAYEAGKHNLAARLMRRTFAVSPLNGDAHAVAAFLQLSDGNAEAALGLARHACRLDRHNTRALCAMVVALDQLGSRSAAERFLARAVRAAESEAERVMVVHTACEISAYAQALTVLQTLAGDQPMDPSLTHLLAVCYCQVGREKEALPLWARMRRIDPDDTVSDYCFESLRAAIAREETFVPNHVRQVPMDETLRRLSRIRALADGDVDTLQHAWQNRDEIRKLVSWGLNQPEPRIRKVMLGLLRVVGDDNARWMLRDALLSTDHPDDFKQLILELLFELGDPGPHYVANNQGFSTAFVQAAEESELPEMHEDALAKLAAHLRSEFGEVVEQLRDMWRQLLKEEGTIVDMDSWLEALEWVYRTENGQELAHPDRRVMRRVRRMQMIWDGALNEPVSDGEAIGEINRQGGYSLDKWPTLEGWLDGQEDTRSVALQQNEPDSGSQKAGNHKRASKPRASKPDAAEKPSKRKRAIESNKANKGAAPESIAPDKPATNRRGSSAPAQSAQDAAAGPDAGTAAKPPRKRSSKAKPERGD